MDVVCYRGWLLSLADHDKKLNKIKNKEEEEEMLRICSQLMDFCEWDKFTEHHLIVVIDIIILIVSRRGKTICPQWKTIV